jgi:hypothetical protein
MEGNLYLQNLQPLVNHACYTGNATEDTIDTILELHGNFKSISAFIKNLPDKTITKDDLTYKWNSAIANSCLKCKLKMTSKDLPAKLRDMFTEIHSNFLEALESCIEADVDSDDDKITALNAYDLLLRIVDTEGTYYTTLVVPKLEPIIKSLVDQTRART